MTKKIYYYLRASLYSFLLETGFKPIGTRPNFRKVGYVVWLFEETPELQAAIRDYFKLIDNQ